MRMDIWYLFQWYLLEYSLETQRLPDITFMEYGKTHRIYQFLFDIIHSHKGGERGTETHSWFRHAQTASTINLLWYKPYCVTPLLRTATGFLFYSEQKAWMIYFPFASWNCLLSISPLCGLLGFSSSLVRLAGLSPCCFYSMALAIPSSWNVLLQNICTTSFLNSCGLGSKLTFLVRPPYIQF